MAPAYRVCMADDRAGFVFPEPWWDLRGDGEREAAVRDQLRSRLQLELGADHPLARRQVAALASFQRQDEILFSLDQGAEFLFAHLTYTTSPPDPFITLRLFATWEDAAAMVREMSEEW